jgi:prephenate dehydrogenase
MERRVTIAGLGLIGGSLGIALRRRGWHVAYFDPNVALDAALAAGAADERTSAPGSDSLLVLATPVDQAIALLHAAGSGPATSVCSVMLPLQAAAQRIRFVAGHPFAGSESSGLAAARGDLFEGRPWFVDRDDEDVDAMIEAAGARKAVVDAAAHDETVALTSHLPQLLSTALASLIEQRNVDPQFIGSGLRTLLRLAGSSFEVWDPVLEANRENVARALDDLMRVAEQLDERDFDRAVKFVGAGPQPAENGPQPAGRFKRGPRAGFHAIVRLTAGTMIRNSSISSANCSG